MDETFSSIDLVTQCMMDQKRTEKFREAIERAVRPGDTVLDSGTGSAILALFAARAGAKKVIAVEYDPYVAQLAVKNIAANGFSDIVEVFVGDIRNMHFAEGTKFDVVIMEMLTTGMIDEYQVWAINNLHERGLVSAQTRFVPARQDTYLALTETDFTNYGLSMRMVKHHWDPYPMWKMRELAKPALISSVPFDRQNPVDYAGEFDFEIR